MDASLNKRISRHVFRRPLSVYPVKYPCISMYISVSQQMKALRYNLPSDFKFPQCVICPQKRWGFEFWDHRCSKLEKMQGPKARSCDCRRQEAPYDYGAWGLRNRRDFEHFMRNGAHVGLLLISYFLTIKSRKIHLNFLNIWKTFAIQGRPLSLTFANRRHLTEHGRRRGAIIYPNRLCNIAAHWLATCMHLYIVYNRQYFINVYKCFIYICVYIIYTDVYILSIYTCIYIYI